MKFSILADERPINLDHNWGMRPEKRVQAQRGIRTRGGFVGIEGLKERIGRRCEYIETLALGIFPESIFLEDFDGTMEQERRKKSVDDCSNAALLTEDE